MTELCYQWGGVVSVATYVPLLNGTLVAEEGAPADWTVPDVIRHLSAFHKQMETEGALMYASMHSTLCSCLLPIIRVGDSSDLLAWSSDISITCIW
jgi:hypothetical protein